ncbi:MAG: hypothetical protein RIC55_09635 [Pirellulaceae bacterium]
MATTTTPKIASKDDVLAKLATGEIDVDTAKTLLEAFNGPNNGQIGVKVRAIGEKYTDSKGSQHEGKGNVLVYGLQRMPVSLYPGQWQRLLDDETRDKILSAIEANRDKLSWK